MLEIQRLRRETAPGDGRRTLREFHDQLLSLGAPPLPTMHREMAAQAG